MEKPRETQRVFNLELKSMIGGLIDAECERNHTIILYEAVPARSAGQKCTICSSGIPVMIKYERDHSAQEFYDAICESCLTPLMREKLKSGKG